MKASFIGCIIAYVSEAQYAKKSATNLNIEVTLKCSFDLNEFDLNEVFPEPIIRLNRGIGVIEDWKFHFFRNLDMKIILYNML